MAALISNQAKVVLPWRRAYDRQRNGQGTNQTSLLPERKYTNDFIRRAVIRTRPRVASPREPCCSQYSGADCEHSGTTVFSSGIEATGKWPAHIVMLLLVPNSNTRRRSRFLACPVLSTARVSCAATPCHFHIQSRAYDRYRDRSLAPAETLQNRAYVPTGETAPHGPEIEHIIEAGLE